MGRVGLLCLVAIAQCIGIDATTAAATTAAKTTAAKTTAAVTTAAPTTAAVRVYSTMLVQGVDYGLIMANVAVKAAFVAEMTKALTTRLGFAATGITVELSSGSVLVTYVVEVPAGHTAATVTAQLQAARATIAQTATELARAIPGINAVVTGTLTATVCGEAEQRVAAWGACAALEKAAVVPLGSMPADLNSALSVGGVTEQGLRQGVLNAVEGHQRVGSRGLGGVACWALIGVAGLMVLAVPIVVRSLRPNFSAVQEETASILVDTPEE
jgi:hypothetical protein